MATYQLFLVPGKVVFRRGQTRRVELVVNALEAQVSQFLLGCRCPVSIVLQEQDPLGELSAAFFLQNVLQLQQHRWAILHVDSLALWKKSMRRILSWTQKIEARTFPADFALRIIWGGVSRYPATPLTVTFSPGHSDITRFRPWSPITTGNHLDRAENVPNLLRRLAQLTFWSSFWHFRNHFAESFLMSKSSWIMDLTTSREMPSCSAID